MLFEQRMVGSYQVASKFYFETISFVKKHDFHRCGTYFIPFLDSWKWKIQQFFS